MRPSLIPLLAVSLAASVEAQDTSPAPAFPMVQRKDSTSCNAPISCEGTQNGTLHATVPAACANYGVIDGQAWASQFDTYDFAGTAGQVISATLGEHTAMNKPILFLLRKSDSSVIISDSADSVGHATIAARLPETT